jgi:hypothetical protein
MKLLWQAVVAATLFCSCHREQRIDIDSALRATSNGQFPLVVITDDFVSFQAGAFQKRQYYFTPPLPESVVVQLRAAVDEARAGKHEVHLEDIRSGARDLSSK